MKVTISKTVTQKLGRLVDILLHEEYFATSANAYKYVDNIYDFIFTIEKRTAHKTKNSKNGSYYLIYKANKRTTWYITFNIRKDDYFIKNITNNHSPDYPDFIRELK